MSIYLASGVFASLTSLAAHVMTNKLIVTSLGASGAISGVVAAWCLLHSKYVDIPFPSTIPFIYSTPLHVYGTSLTFHSTTSSEKLTIWLLPSAWQETFSASGEVFLLGIVAIEILSLVLPFKFAAMDHWSHLGGYAAGAAGGLLWKRRERERVRERRKAENGVWGSWFGGSK
jgi:rhomboid-like protein